MLRIPSIFEICRKSVISIAVSAGLPLMMSCSGDVAGYEPEMPQPETSEVAVEVSFSDGWSIGSDATRVAPPGIGGNQGGGAESEDSSGPVAGEDEISNVDCVRIIAFRRKDPDGADTQAAYDMLSEASFVYDASNDKVIPVEEQQTDGDGNIVSPDHDDIFGPAGENGSHAHCYAKGTLKKVYGFEYKVIAIAYLSKEPSPYNGLEDQGNFKVFGSDLQRFSLNVADGLTLDEFKLSIVSQSISNNKSSWQDFFNGEYWSSGFNSPDAGVLSGKAIETPQIFYAGCFTEFNGDRNEIIKYSVDDNSGEATVQNKEIPVRGILYRGMAKVELRITPTPRKGTLANYYPKWIALMADNVNTESGLSDYDDFLTSSTPLPHKSTSGIYSPIAYYNTEGIKEEVVITAYMLPVKTKLAVRIKDTYNIVRNKQLTTIDVNSPGNATGIISPDLHDGVFYLRRNHKYVITVSDSEKLFN